MLIVRYLTFLGLALLFSGCMPNTPYRTLRDAPPDPTGVIHSEKGTTIPALKLAPSMECTEGDRCVNFVEFDEFGNAESRNQFNAGLTAVKAVAEHGGMVVVYIHGWHHNAKIGDSDITNFRNLVKEVEQGKPVVGIYVGWRGESINSDSVLGYGPSYLGTFWDRKNTAHTIGNAGGVTELLRTLSDIRSRNPTSRLLVIGHSFGGAILYSALSDGIAEQIRRDCQRSKQYTPIADLVVLINPAFEAMRLRPIYSYARNFEYPDEQKPRLMIITSKADSATGFFFKIGRHLGTIFQGYPDGAYKEQDVTAIGHYTPYITHQLKTVSSCSDRATTFSFAGNGRPLSMCIDGKLELTRCDSSADCAEVANGHFIDRGEAGTHIPHRFPIYNIRATRGVIPSHVDIWEKPMQLLLHTLLEEVQHSETMPLAPTDCGVPAGQIAPPI